MRLHTLKDVLMEQLRDLYDAEIRYREILPRLVERSTHADLATVLAAVARQTEENIRKLALACAALGCDPGGISCEAMKGLVRESQGTADHPGESAAIDAALIANAQRIAHYEIAGFGTAKAFAAQLGADAVAADLDDLLSDAYIADAALTRIATEGRNGVGVNKAAVTGT